MSVEVEDELFDLLASTVASCGLELVDLQLRPGLVRVVVDRDSGADLDAIADATRAVSGALDRHDPSPGRRYTLEVSSPGLERPLRTARQFQRAVGEVVSVRTASGAEGERRLRGRLLVADDEGIELESVDPEVGVRRLSYDDVDRARTVFEWGPATAGGRSRTGRRRSTAAGRAGGARPAEESQGKRVGTP